MYIAERKLLASNKGSSDLFKVVVKISKPYVVKSEDVSFPVDGVIAGCKAIIDGLDDTDIESEVFGMDTLQAVNLASNIDPILARYSDRYDFFWADGEPYFEG